MSKRRQASLFDSLEAPRPGHQGTAQGAVVREVRCRTLLNRCSIDDYSFNCYTGCEHGCAYCYARFTGPEFDARQAEFRLLSSASLPWRALHYLLGCWACQTFWTAVVIYAVTAGITALAACLFSAAAYSGAAVLLSVVHGSGLPVRGDGPINGRAGCKGCGQ